MPPNDIWPTYFSFANFWSKIKKTKFLYYNTEKLYKFIYYNRESNFYFISTVCICSKKPSFLKIEKKKRIQSNIKPRFSSYL